MMYRYLDASKSCIPVSEVEHEIHPAHKCTFWFKLYFNCYKYKHIITENIKYPGSDKKPKACPKVISWQTNVHFDRY